MTLYLSIIGVAMAIISVLNIAFSTAPWYYVIISVIWCTALQFGLDGAIAIIINKMPDEWFGLDKKIYRVSKKEINIYKKLRVREWKDKVWELGGLGGFSKKNLTDPNNPEYIEKFIIECNKGVMTHKLSYPIGFLAMLTLPGTLALTIALPVALVYVFLNFLPTTILRYNTPMLTSVLKRLRRKEAKKAEGEAVGK